ncbi:type II toxin-antitoxin system VapC family toxin [Candidatus Poribacteria bacterium]
MSVSYLIDTDWAVHHLNGVEKVRMKLMDMKSDGLGLSFISLAELYEGAYYSRDPETSHRQLVSLLSSVTVLGVNDEICRIFGQQRGYLRQRGLMIGDFDLLIAATCLHHGLALLTNNRRHFQRIEDLKIVSIEF